MLCCCSAPVMTGYNLHQRLYYCQPKFEKGLQFSLTRKYQNDISSKPTAKSSKTPRLKSQHMRVEVQQSGYRFPKEVSCISWSRLKERVQVRILTAT